MKSYSENVNVDPTFDNAKGEAYFRNIYSEQHPNRVFQRPDWIPILPPPSLPFLHDCLTPSYNDISRIIRKMKSSSTPCPLDGISVIIFKRCPILRTHLARLLATCWEKGIFPKIWKKASVILIHKKGDPSDPQNFRPIALQPVLGKIFNSCIRNRLWHYFTNNNLIDLKIQKGFWPGIDGVTEHTELLQYLMHHQKIHKREFYIILLDLKNAFGEVHHSLIRFSLLHHHVPPQTADLIMSQYQAFHLNITAKNCTLQTGAIHVQRGVLQGDTLSPLLFNLVFNTLMTSISQPALHSHGVLWGDGCTRSLWTQFADDAAVLGVNHNDTQLVITFFQRWAAWADLIIRPDKSFAYGAAQRSGHYIQIAPTFTLNGLPIPSISPGATMTYLGRGFSFSSSHDAVKESLLSSLQCALAFSDSLPITPLLKCHALNLQLRAKLSFPLSHYQVSKSWIESTLDPKVTEKVRHWLDLPLSATAHFFPLPANLLGLNIILPSLLSELCLLSTQRILLHSRDPSMATLHDLARPNPPSPFHHLLMIPSSKTALLQAKKIRHFNQIQKLDNLSVQSIILSSLRAALPHPELSSWANHLMTISPTISSFARKALIRCLPTNANLHRWLRTKSPACPQCGQPETQTHVLNNCSPSAVQGRYTWRHNAVLKLISTHITPHLLPSDILLTDIPGSRSPTELFTNILPDVTVIRDGSAHILELTCCAEVNFEKSKVYKLNKYSNPSSSSKQLLSFHVHTLEVSSLGFVQSSGFKAFLNSLSLPSLSDSETRRLGEMSLRASFFIFCCRHKPWPSQPCDPYFH